MQKKTDIKRFTAEELEHLRESKGSQTDWSRVDRMTEEELEDAIASDPDEHDLSADWTQARLTMPKTKKSIHLRIDPDVLDWLKKQGKGYQTRINAILRSYYEAHKDDPRA